MVGIGHCLSFVRPADPSNCDTMGLLEDIVRARVEKIGTLAGELFEERQAKDLNTPP
jgi:hypothetical protein